jgi:beta-N-acetylhexosaminidase
LGGGAVESGEEKTREPYTPATYIDLLRARNPSIVDVRFHDSIPLSADSEKAIDEADTVIFATRNASLSPYQKDFGLSLGKKLGKKLIVIATCDPYDFLKEKGEVKNYITIYEPTIPAFKSAVDVMFGVTKALGTLPVGQSTSQDSGSSIRLFEESEGEIDHIWNLWRTIFPKWPIERDRLGKILSRKSGMHFAHDYGFCLSFVGGGHAQVAIIGVLPEHRGKGIGTGLISKAVYELKHTVPNLLSLTIRSTFPRLWPGVPVDFSAEAKDFFLHRGIFLSLKIYPFC